MAGGSGCGGDIGTHALMQLRYVTGLDVEQLSAQLETFVEGRALDDHFTIYCKLSNGAKALVRATQIAIGHKKRSGPGNKRLERHAPLARRDPSASRFTL